ncbi:hypothetical protein [uncultured Methylobacterium sp.]|uniref:hypothetical protein n=1 Tax=uncultured Methylobacterium sp. TaxID=157278 RepID=UPI0035CB76EE
MRFRALALASSVLIAGAAQAQSPAVVTPGAPGTAGPGTVDAPGGPGVLTRQSGAVGSEGAVTYSPTGQPADTISNDSAAAGNANQPSRVAPQGGAGGK